MFVKSKMDSVIIKKKCCVHIKCKKITKEFDYIEREFFLKQSISIQLLTAKRSAPIKDII